ncbi:hypothetical protein [Kineococcus rubinsiae]|uniref:hypothetical protein n=1 Tax=Kineococcus rubinsiae TaxID=2609562 RepID=UPI00142FE6F1|nr:hypothetical protein [Kineococcus rubinsiae]NIZ90300.1 hypothetical protein [Kineococcus rubinsiae]
MAVVLGGCGGSAPLEGREAAVASCKQLATEQYDLKDAGDDLDVRELSIENGESFRVDGASDDVSWTCTWTFTLTGETRKVEVSVDQQ